VARIYGAYVSISKDSLSLKVDMTSHSHYELVAHTQNTRRLRAAPSLLKRAGAKGKGVCAKIHTIICFPGVLHFCAILAPALSISCYTVTPSHLRPQPSFLKRVPPTGGGCFSHTVYKIGIVAKRRNPAPPNDYMLTLYYN